MKEIEEFKKENGGGISYTIKELVAGLHKKIDNIDKKLDEHCELMAEIREKVARATAKSDKKIAILETFVGIHTILIIGLLWVIVSS